MENLSAKILELSQDVYVIPSSTNVGVILNPVENCTEVYLVDSGCTEIEGEYVLDVIKAFFEERNETYTIKAILTTHGHADHCGANSFIKTETGCLVYASKPEQANIETPIVQCTTLWGGYPPHELRTLYFKPERCSLDEYLYEGLEIPLSDGKNISFMELNGHSYCEIAVIVNYKNEKRVVFAGDSIFPRKELGKYWIPLIINPVEFMDSLDKLCSIENMEWCIPSHGDFLKRNIQETAELNKIAILSTRMCIIEALKDKKKHSIEDIIKYVADKNGFEMTFGQYALISSTVRSYVAVMHDAKEIKIEVSHNRMMFYLP